MGWVAIITALIQVFGPVLARLIEGWLHRAADHMPAPNPDAEHAAQVAMLFDSAITLARFRPGIRRALERLRPMAMARAAAAFAVAADPRATGPAGLSDEERAGLVGLGE